MLNHPQILEFYPVDPSDIEAVDQHNIQVQSGGQKLTLQHNDQIRLQIHKSFFKYRQDEFAVDPEVSTAGDPPEIHLYGKETPEADETKLQRVGIVQRLESEKYFEILLLFTSIPGGHAQFSITREDGSEAFGTFKEQHETLEAYIEAVAVWFEDYQYTPISAEINGNYLRLKIYKVANFYDTVSGVNYLTNSYKNSPNWWIENEQLSVEIGSVSDFNTNTPTLKSVAKGSEAIAATNIIDLIIGEDIQKGNVFKFGGKTYKATGFDTTETIKSYFFDGAEQYSILQSESSSVSVDKGFVNVANSNLPTFNVLYDSTSGGKDLYTVEVDDISEGNIFVILENGEEERIYTALESDTKTEVEAFFNNEGGFMKVNEGRTVTWRYSQGERSVENSNLPSIKIEILSSLAAQTVDNYDIYVGTSVTEGNIFTLGGVQVTATAEDTFETVYTKLGLETGKYYQVPTGDSFATTAAKGSPYNSGNIPDIEIIQQPESKTSEYVKADIILDNTESYIGNYRFAISGTIFDYFSYFAISQYFELLPSVEETTSVISYRDEGRAFGFSYYDKEDYQQIRIPCQVHGHAPSIFEEKSTDNDGKEHTQKVIITNTSNLSSDVLSIHQSSALTLALKHKEVFIDGAKVEVDDVSFSQIEGSPNNVNVNAELRYQDSVFTNLNEKGTIASSHLEMFRLKNADSLNVFHVVLKNSYITERFNGSFDTYVRPLECYPEIYVAGFMGDQKALTVAGETATEINPTGAMSSDYVLVEIYENGYRIVSEFVKSGHKNKLQTVIRFTKGNTYEIKTKRDFTELKEYTKSKLEEYVGLNENDYESVTYQNETE